MSDRVYSVNNVLELTKAPLMRGISRVHLDVSEEQWYEAGDETGRTVTLQTPWGTQEMCDNILQTLRGYQHQPMEASGAQIDPAAEVWDSVTVGGVHGGLGTIVMQYGPAITSDISSPGEEAVEHEFPYVSPADRTISRKMKEIRASLNVTADTISAEVSAREQDSEEIRATLLVQAGQIAAKVEKIGGNSSFAWSMTDSEQVWSANGSEIFRLDANGAKVTGEIRATSGVIGGFEIGADDLRYNNQSWQGTNSQGAYIGTNGIQLGSWDGGFHVDSSGNLYAYSGEFRGSVSAGNIQYGGDNGTMSGAGISAGSMTGNRLCAGTITTAYTADDINTSLYYANDANSILRHEMLSEAFKCKKVTATKSLYADTAFFYQKRWVLLKTLNYKASDGSNATMTVLSVN